MTRQEAASIRACIQARRRIADPATMEHLAEISVALAEDDLIAQIVESSEQWAAQSGWCFRTTLAALFTYGFYQGSEYEKTQQMIREFGGGAK